MLRRTGAAAGGGTAPAAVQAAAPAEVDIRPAGAYMLQTGLGQEEYARAIARHLVQAERHGGALSQTIADPASCSEAGPSMATCPRVPQPQLPAVDYGCMQSATRSGPFPAAQTRTTTATTSGRSPAVTAAAAGGGGGGSQPLARAAAAAAAAADDAFVTTQASGAAAGLNGVPSQIGAAAVRRPRPVVLGVSRHALDSHIAQAAATAECATDPGRDNGPVLQGASESARSAREEADMLRTLRHVGTRIPTARLVQHQASDPRVIDDDT